VEGGEQKSDLLEKRESGEKGKQGSALKGVPA